MSIPQNQSLPPLGEVPWHCKISLFCWGSLHKTRSIRILLADDREKSFFVAEIIGRIFSSLEKYTAVQNIRPVGVGILYY